jgi:hypothetical protein
MDMHCFISNTTKLYYYIRLLFMFILVALPQGIYFYIFGTFSLPKNVSEIGR